jgi:hypothetical protein
MRMCSSLEARGNCGVKPGNLETVSVIVGEAGPTPQE